MKGPHEELTKHSWKAKETAKKCYGKVVQEVKFKPGDRVVVFYPPDVLGSGRKLSAPWLGPYRVHIGLGYVGYLLVSEWDPSKTAWVHVNRLRAWDERLKETGDSRDGVFPDSRLLLKAIKGHRDTEVGREYELPSVGRRGCKWVTGNDLPEVVVRAYDSVMKAYPALVVDVADSPLAGSGDV